MIGTTRTPAPPRFLVSAYSHGFVALHTATSLRHAREITRRECRAAQRRRQLPVACTIRPLPERQEA